MTGPEKPVEGALLLKVVNMYLIESKSFFSCPCLCNFMLGFGIFVAT